MGSATRLRTMAVLGAGLLLACATAVQAQTDDELSKLLKRQTQEFSDAGQRGDKAVLDGYLDPSVMFTEEDRSSQLSDASGNNWQSEARGY
jgi:hypothetical protein